MKRFLVILLFLVAPAAFAQTTIHNDDSCDVVVAPAATLLLPYFEVDFKSVAPEARTTLFSVTNVTAAPRIARVTLWTDWAYPVIAFNVFLTGYDVQAINLYDIFARGAMSARVGSPGPRALPNGGEESSCRANMPAQLPDAMVDALQRAFTTGFYEFCGAVRIGGVHANAIGYATVDVVDECAFTTPAEARYYTDELLYDNVLIGDFQSIEPKQNFASGEPLVHIRAIPEGGSSSATNLPLTFYERFSHGSDRRQPLASVFAARYVQGGTRGFLTNFKIWREGLTGTDATCFNYTDNRMLEVGEVVRFDERENPTSIAPQVIIPEFVIPTFVVPATSMIATTNTSFPPLTSGDVAGWMYMNFDMTGLPPRAARSRQSQAWVVVSMQAEGRYAVDFTAAPLGNGCSPRMPQPTTRGSGENPIRPRP